MQRLDGGDEAGRPPGSWGCYLVKLRVQNEGSSVQRIIGICLAGQIALSLVGNGICVRRLVST